jgi:Rab family protein
MRTGYYNESAPTIGAAYAAITEGGKTIHFWDTAGQERFSHFLPQYLRTASIAVVCFELFDAERVDHYLEVINENSPDSDILWVITKADLFAKAAERRTAASSLQRYLIKDKGMTKNCTEIYTTSALSGMGVELLKENLFGLVSDTRQQTDDSIADPRSVVVNKFNECCHLM